MTTHEAFWRPIFEGEPREVLIPGDDNSDYAELDGIWRPISEREVRDIRPSSRTSPGPDGIKMSAWKMIPDIAKALFFNIMLRTTECPMSINDSPTILIPKKKGTMEPAEFRPLSIASIIQRHLHKILANRLNRLNIIDRRQRAFILADGVAENTTTLAAMLRDARGNRRAFYLATLDMRKAFDTVTPEAINATLKKKELPQEMRK